MVQHSLFVIILWKLKVFGEWIEIPQNCGWVELWGVEMAADDADEHG